MRIKRLHISKMPGFPNGLKPYEQFAGNINIIAGANGTGKSSTARLLQNLLWKSCGKHNSQAAAEIEVNKEQHAVFINASGYTHTDGSHRATTDDFSGVVSPEYARHYMLALHDLIQATDHDLAEKIMDEINGGISLKNASRQLGYSNAFYGAKRQEVTEYKAAAETYKNKLREQESLEMESRRLQSLYHDKRNAEQAKSLNEYYRNVLELLHAKAQKSEAESLLKRFSSRYEHLYKDDYTTIVNLEEKLNTSLAQKEKLIREKEALTLQLQKEGVPDETFLRLETILEELKEKKKSLESVSEEIIRLETDKQRYAASIGPHLPDENAKAVSLPEISELESFTRNANDTAFEQYRLAASHKTITAEINDFKAQHQLEDNAPDISAINKGIAELSKWLKEEGATGDNDNRSLYLLAAVSIISLSAAYFTWWAVIAGIIAVLLVGSYAISQNKKKHAADNSLAIREADYLKLGLDTPLQWDSEHVKSLIDHLITLREKREKLQGLESETAKLTAQLEETGKKAAQIEEHYQKLLSYLYPLPDSLTNTNDKYNTLFYYLEKLHQWQAVSGSLEKAIRQKSAYEDSIRSLVSDANHILESIHEKAADDSIALQAILQRLKQEENRRRDNATRLEGILPRLHDNEESIEELSASLENIYKRIQLPAGEKEEVRRLLEDFEEYKQAEKEYERASSAEEILHNRISASSYFNAEVINTGIEEAEKRVNETAAEAAKYNEIVESISGIEARINVRKQNRDLEIALERQDKAVENLQLLLNKNLHSITGSIITEHLKEEVSLQNNNRIFQEAQRILGKITHNRYRLQLSDDDPPSFSVIDNDSGTLLQLDELSTGTRIQLLFAVRLAYIQSIEQEVKLPIMVDELLASSDDQRSDAIISSLIEISKERQVFYFTAQSDEVDKWKELLDKQTNISHKIYLLDNAPVAYQKKKPLSGIPLLYQEIPAPGKLSHAEYGKVLNVPDFDLIGQPVSSLHSWYLIPDVQQLYNCLQKGLTTWGRLKDAIYQLTPESLGLTEAAAGIIIKKAALLESLKKYYSIGRPRRIDRMVLEQSGSIPAKQMDIVADLLDKSNGDPLLLLEGLTGIDGFGPKRKKTLEDFLIREEYIDNKAPLDDSELHQALVIAANRIGIDLHTADAFINLFIMK